LDDRQLKPIRKDGIIGFHGANITLGAERPHEAALVHVAYRRRGTGRVNSYGVGRPSKLSAKMRLNTTSSAPTSQFGPCGRGTPR